MLKFCLLVLALLSVTAASAQQCTETAPCQQLACETVSGYCSFCTHDTNCDPDGTSGMLDCYQTTTWTDWYFGTTCDSSTNEYCLYDCASFISSEPPRRERKRAQGILYRIRRRNAERSKHA